MLNSVATVQIPAITDEEMESLMGPSLQDGAIPEKEQPELTEQNSSRASKPNAKELERCLAVSNRFDRARKTRTESGVEDEWAEAERLYNQQDDHTQEGSWRSDAFVPHATREVNTAVPHLVSAVLDAEGLVSITTPSSDPVVKDYALMEQKIIEHQLEQRTNFPNVMELWAKQTVMLGTGVVFVGYAMQKKEIEIEIEKDIAAGITTTVKEDRVITVDGCPTIAPLDIADVWVDPLSTPLYIPRVWYYERRSIRQLKAMGIKLKNLDTLTNSPPTMEEYFKSDFQKDDTVAIGSRRSVDAVLTADLPYEDRPHHILYEYDNESKKMTIVADSNVELLEPTEFKNLPFVFSHYDYASNRFYGIGVVSPISKSCRSANRLRRQRDDNVELCLSKMMVVRAGAIADEQGELIWKPGGVIHARGGSIENVMKVLEMGDVTQSSYADERIIKGDIEDVNGISNVAAGKSDSKSKTATGTSILRQMAVLRLRGPVRRMLQSIKQVVELMVEGNKTYLPYINKEYLLGPSSEIYKTYEAKYRDYACVISVNPANLYDNSEVINAQLLNAVNIAGGLGLLQFLDQKELAKRIFTSVAKLASTDPLFTPVAPPVVPVPGMEGQDGGAPPGVGGLAPQPQRMPMPMGPEDAARTAGNLSAGGGTSRPSEAIRA